MSANTLKQANDIMQPLLTIMEKLRDPETGCPWDKQQSFETIVPFTLEEAYEVADAIEQADLDSLPDELGDLLFQVVFYCQLGKEQGLFDFATVVDKICDKLTRRHPHVFSGDNLGTSAEQVKLVWDEIKQQERLAKSQHSILDDIPVAMPALNRAIKIQKRVAKVGFDWADLAPVVAKVHEEIDEVMAEAQHLEANKDEYYPKVVDEMGDLLFAVANMARHLGVEPEQALRLANQKFERRFKGVEQYAAQSGKAFEQHSLEELDSYWDQVKMAEKSQQLSKD
ncbi:MULTISPECIES: nucleoside triphosphate pyrophosphohydrolase [unclassified Shewanella]|uniref:nucleoside triphosphate pyrophosphohydrolase n=1 Tax=unclassified Shewanella TaxID=196818 RepID=UPI000C8406AE|nr:MULTISPECIES: nucleoside triphosphate pyrophosphohydrolase [unclassified Shewanella]MDO6620448.1 nucleoside triphosphate pyrophosphohydrolase [Shewanella sp. 6_MG-2023]PMG40285.1 nucleoside triphosphate pyrophosphohydrolase [Shewanella sp. 10N.286.52.B9]